MSNLHLVFGGRVSDPTTLDFNDLKSIDIVGMFPNYKSAEDAWRAAAQKTVDDAEMKYAGAGDAKALTHIAAAPAIP
jgi:hypothetical protein